VATFASRSCTQCCRWWTHGETVACDVAEVEADSTSATVARNVAGNNFKGEHKLELSSCARCCGQCSTCVCAFSISNLANSNQKHFLLSLANQSARNLPVYITNVHKWRRKWRFSSKGVLLAFGFSRLLLFLPFFTLFSFWSSFLCFLFAWLSLDFPFVEKVKKMLKNWTFLNKKQQWVGRPNFPSNFLVYLCKRFGSIFSILITLVICQIKILEFPMTMPTFWKLTPLFICCLVVVNC